VRRDERPAGGRRGVVTESLGPRNTISTNIDPELRCFVDRVVVPALLDRFLAETQHLREDGQAERPETNIPPCPV
jgi:hypothetical protein